MENLSSIIILGGDGYLGWPLSLRLARRHPLKKIIVVDNLLRRKLVSEVGGSSLLPILEPEIRLQKANEIYGLNNIQFLKMDINSEALADLIRDSQPEAIYHLAQQCSAPYSMRGCQEALFTLNNNEGGNMRLLWAVKQHVPNCHIIKLGSFGEYAKSGLDVCEGYFQPEFRGKRAQRPVPYPREADDFYHVSKINDTNYISVACRKWGLRITDIMQSTVFGSWTEDVGSHSELFTRVDYDESFGTVANRFVIQSLIGQPLTIYGSGHQRTGLMALNDCIESLSQLWNQLPPVSTHRVINHLTEESYSINELAQTIKHIASKEGFKVDIQRGTHDPRGENNSSKLEYSIERLHISRNINTTPLREVVAKTFQMLLPYQKQINSQCLCPMTIWNNQSIHKDLNFSDKNLIFDSDEVPEVACEADWEVYRSWHFPNQPVNLNPGTLGTLSLDALTAMKKFEAPEILACPMEQYQQGQNAMRAATKIAEEIWPAPEHTLHIGTSATQCANLLALTLARVGGLRKRPLRVLTTAHEHIGGIGALQRMREFELIYLSELEILDLSAFQARVAQTKPDIGFFSHITYDYGRVLPISNWSAIMKSVRPETLILADISQSLGLLQPPFDQTDVLFSSGHKWLFGPRGSGFLWTNERFRKEVEALHWSGDSFTTDPKTSGFGLTGGLDFAAFVGLESALKLHQKAGEEKIRERGVQLKNFFQQSLSLILKNHKIPCDFVATDTESTVEVGILSVSFPDYDPYPLYLALNNMKLYCKCIKDKDQRGRERKILRFGFPYYETSSRLKNALLMLDQNLHENFSDRLRIHQDSDTIINLPLDVPWSAANTAVLKTSHV